MCLLTNSEKLKVAKKPIKCYKLVVLDAVSVIYLSLVQRSYIPDSVIQGEKNYIAVGSGTISKPEFRFGPGYKNWLGKKYCLNAGYIHCMSNKEDALKFCRYYIDEDADIHLFEVEVPENIEYARGVNGYSLTNNHPLNGLNVIAAKEIKFIKEIEWKKK